MPTETVGDNTGNTYSGTEDSQARSAASTTNYSGIADLSSFSWAPGDDGTFAIRFTGLSSIVGPITVSAAQVSFWLGSEFGEDPKQIELRRLLRNWVESEITADIFSTGNAWQTQLGVGANDISSTVSASLNVGVTTGQYYVWSDTQLATDVQNWVNGVNPNNGWLCKPETFDHGAQAHVFVASRGSDGQRPILEFTYTASGGGGVTIPRLQASYRRRR